ncbi:MAG: hypothetical protein NXH91_18830 [Phyllobacteriaceae bacterium]|jgi:hypothetical protein|nr:hypothetical protein [Phyllobacteriaceae bacterium]
MIDPETDLNALLDDLLGPDPEADARAEAETAALATRAAQFVANRAGRWKKCPKRACRRAHACTGEGLPAALPPCGAKGDWPAINGLVLFTILERLEAARREFKALKDQRQADRATHARGEAWLDGKDEGPFSQRSGDAGYML